MKDKIIQLMKSEGLSSSRLAEILEIQPSGVSHLVSGRNKPGFDLLQKILKRFPNINPYWLMLDDEEMYCRQPELSEPQESPEQLPPPLMPLMSEPRSEAPEAHPLVNVSQVLEESLPLPTPPIRSENSQPQMQDGFSSKIDFSLPRVKRVILLYDDDTCETYRVK